MIINERLSGILLHPTSCLPLRDWGSWDEAYAFIDFGTGRSSISGRYATDPHRFRDSPYQSFSAFAGQPLLIDPRHLIPLD